MTQSIKHLVALALAIFAMAAMSLSAVQAGNMALEMGKTASYMTAMADGKNASGDDCQACPGGLDQSDAMTCPTVCVAPAVAVVPQALILAAVLASGLYVFPSSPWLGRASLPDPYPPRFREPV